MSRPKIIQPSAVQRTAKSLRHRAMAAAEGTLIGSEEDLMTAFEVSRPTLRQAAALVAQDHLIMIRRGVNGGYFAAMPSSGTVARMAALFLQSRDAGLKELIQAVEPIRGELARLAARNADEDGRRMLRDFLEKDKAIGENPSDYRAFFRAEREFGKVLGLLSTNSVLGLFLGIVYDLAARVRRDEDVYLNHPERVERYRVQRNWMAAAILDGDEDLAVVATRRCSAIVIAWMQEDLAERGFQHAAVGG